MKAKKSDINIIYRHPTIESGPQSVADMHIIIDRNEEKIIFEYDKDFFNSKRESLFNNVGEKDSLHPLFISSRTRKNFQPNLLLQEICVSPESYKKTIIFLFIEGGLPGERENFKEDIEFYSDLQEKEFRKIKDKFSLPNEAKNPIIKVFLPERNLGLGRKRKIMMLVAEHFALNRFYFIDDDIECFYQYDDDRMEHTTRNLESVTFNALNYMSKVLDHEISKNIENQTVEDEIYRKWLKQLLKLDDIFVNSRYKNDLEYVQDLIQNKNLKDRDSLFDKFSVLKTSNLLKRDQLKVIESFESSISNSTL
jgi:hypothetical protein